MILGFFSILLAVGLGQTSFDLPLNIEAEQKKAEETASSRTESKLQGELLLRFRKYDSKDFNAIAPLLEMEWVHEKITGDSRTIFNLGGRYFKIDDHEFEPLVYAGFQSGNYSLKVGYQTISWGQSFAVFSADLVNPKDLRDPLNTDPTWINIPVMMLNSEYFFEGGGLQFFVTPVPRNNKYPSSGKESDFLKSQGQTLQFASPDEFPKDLRTEDAEYGAKLNYIFKNGLEMSLFGLRHWNRNPLYLTQFEGTQAKAKPLRFQLDSFGLGFNLDLNDRIEGLVARGDYVIHLHDQRANSSGTGLLTKTTWDYVTGFDWTSDKGWALGAQVISHINDINNENLGTLRVTKKLFEDKLEVSALYFAGLNSVQQWIQPKFTWIPESALEISVMADFVEADSKDTWSSLAPLKKEDRTQLQFRYLF